MAPDAVETRLLFLCANIGRGHPFYLDGLRQAIEPILPEGVKAGSLRVLDVSAPLGRLAWRGLGMVYRHGSSPGLWSHVYERLRRGNDYNRDRFVLRLLQRSLRSKTLAGTRSVVVSHPLLVAALRPHTGMYYQHGEVVTPAEAVVLGAHRVFVPTEAAALPFIAAGYDRSQVVITGLCIEPILAARAQDCLRERARRWQESVPLTGAFFSSGAEPAPHVKAITAAVQSAVLHGGRALVFAERGRSLHAAIARLRPHTFGAGSGRLTLLAFDTRAQLEARTAAHFDRFDYFVAPPHERSNWALGLGLPMFLLGPDKGPFAPLNRRLLLAQGVALPLDPAVKFGPWLLELRNQGRLADMASRGIGRHSTQGFAEAARFLAREVASDGRQHSDPSTA